MRWLIAVFAFALLLAPAAAAQEIPFRLVRNSILLPVKVNGVDTTARLDTGGQYSMTTRASAARLNLTISGRADRTGVSGRFAAFEQTAPAVFVLGGQTVTSRPLTVTGEGSATMIPGASELTLGMDVMREFVVEIDFDRSVIRFTPAAQFAAPAGLPVPIRRVGNDRSIPASVTARPSVRAEFDTGHPGTLDLSADVAERAIEGRPASTRAATGVDSVIRLRTSTLPELILGGATLRNVPVNIRSDRERGRLMLGMDILKRFNLVMDFSRDRMWMTPNSLFDAPYRKDRLGIWRYGEAWGRPGLLVSPGSPAERAGLRDGDRIAQVIDASGAPLTNLEDLPAGQQVVVILHDGARKEMTTADYY
jgi:hypothetical protein